MGNTYDKGLAFICEGGTDKEFYLSLLQFFCEKYNTSISKKLNDKEPDIIYELKKCDKTIIIKFHDAGSIYGMPKSSKWFEAECVKKYGSKTPWIVFLCYDTDAYTNNITQFHKGDWKDLRGKLKNAQEIVDLAAAADIEDIMLIDLEGICAFIHHPLVESHELSGRKGCSKMKQLYRECGISYHKGSRARSMIDCLDKQKIIDSHILAFNKIEDQFK